jgi:hypothetical protein
MSDDPNNKRETNLQFEGKFNLQETANSLTMEPAFRRQNKIEQEKMMRYLQQTPKFKSMYGQARKVMNDPKKMFSAEYALNQSPELHRDFDNSQFNQAHLKLIDKLVSAEVRNSKLIRQHGLTKSALLRGKLGVDTFFIGFGIIGLFMLPVYFYYRGSGNRDKMSLVMKRFEESNARDLMDLDDMSVDLKHPKSAEAKERIIDGLKHAETVKRLAKSDRESLEQLDDD